jgi:hypothetical protein
MSVGVFGIGLAAYWPQFDGLKERVEGYQRRVEERVAELGGDVISAGLVDSEQAGREAGDRFAADDEPRLREHRHRRVAGQLRGLLRAGARGRLHARGHPL